MKKFKTDNKGNELKTDITDISRKFQNNVSQISESSAEVTSEISSISSIVKSITVDIVSSGVIFENLKEISKHAVSFLEENKKNVNKNISFIEDVKKAAYELNDIVNKTTEETVKAFILFDDLSKYSKNIAEIINVVSTISEQTTLLAFNAAIEAAKAGQCGDGFAVVADEVRMLAIVSDKNVKEIEILIKETSLDIQYNAELISKLKVLTRLNKRRTEIIGESLDTMKESLLSIYGSIDVLINEISGSVEDLKTLCTPLNSIQDLASNLLEDLSKTSDEISNLVNKVSEDGKTINMLLSIEGSASVKEKKDNYNEKVRISNKISSLVKTYVIGKSIRVFFNSSIQKYEDIKQVIQNFTKSSDLLNKEIENNNAVYNDIVQKSKIVFHLICALRASDHIIYNEILETSIKEKTVYQGQINPDKCSFGKWFNTYRPHNQDESFKCQQVKELHNKIHTLFAESVELMKMNKYDEAASLYVDQIKPTTSAFIEKLRHLREGILIIATGFNYTTKLVEKISTNIKEISKPFKKISKVVNSIDNIFVQTNMLSVNGSIEAARAGEYGKGFFFIGNDIKTLASETNENNEKIKEHLEQIFELTDTLKKGFEEVDSLINDQNKAASSVTLSLLDIEKAVNYSTDFYRKLIVQLREISQESNKFIDSSKTIQDEIMNLTERFNKANDSMRQYIGRISKIEQNLEGIQWQFFNE